MKKPFINRKRKNLFQARNLYRIPLLFLVLFGWTLAGCYKFEGAQTIPAYLKIDSLFLQTVYARQGENTQKITDVWVFVDDQQIGVFELPALFPVLASGKHKLELRAGIKLNGISSTRVPYPFYQPIVYNDFTFYPDSIQNLGTLSTTYYDNLTFAWIEDFETPNNSLQVSSDSDTTLVRTQPANNPVAWLSDYSRYSGMVTLTSDRPHFDASTFNAYHLPQMGAPVLLELNFKTDNYLTVGLVVREASRYIKYPLVILNYSASWSKIYINLGPTVSKYTKALDFKVYFAADKRTDSDTTHIYLDNLKLIYRAK